MSCMGFWWFLQEHTTNNVKQNNLRHHNQWMTRVPYQAHRSEYCCTDTTPHELKTGALCSQHDSASHGQDNANLHAATASRNCSCRRNQSEGRGARAVSTARRGRGLGPDAGRPGYEFLPCRVHPLVYDRPWSACAGMSVDVCEFHSSSKRY